MGFFVYIPDICYAENLLEKPKPLQDEHPKLVLPDASI